MRKILSIILFFAAALCANAQSPTLPPVSIKDINGKTVSAASLSNDGKPVIISFWATWCKPCNRELNNIKDLYDEWQEETGLKLIAISVDDSRSASKVKPHVEGNDWPYEVYIDQNGDLKRSLNIVNVPHTIILNGNGEIVWQHAGYQDGSEEEVIEEVRKLIK